MAGFPGWGVDPNRREEYYFSKQEQRWIYRSEEKIQESGNTTREQKNSISASERNDDESINEGMKYVYLGKSRPLRDGDEDSDESVNIGSRSHGFSKGESNPKRATFRYPDFKRRKPGLNFFVLGRVFRVLWTETIPDSIYTTTTNTNAIGEPIATIIRWFVVVKEGKHSCTCLPIDTYKGMGVAMRGVVKATHGIAYTCAHEPLPELSEIPKRGETPMRPGIQIRPRNNRPELHQMSRIDFGRMYTVKHYSKVSYFGDVEEKFRKPLISQWMRVLTKREDEEEGDENESDNEHGDKELIDEDIIQNRGDSKYSQPL